MASAGKRTAATAAVAAEPNATTSVARPRTKPADVRREELMAAAAQIFIERGIAATKIEEIVAAADVGKGTFYLHFDSKERLLQALQARFVERFFGDLQAAMDERRPNDHRGRLRAWIATGVDIYLDRAAEHDLVFHQFHPEGPREPHDNPIVTQLAELLADGVRANAWLTATPRLTAVMLFAALHGALDEAVTPPPPPRPKPRAPASSAAKSSPKPPAKAPAISGEERERLVRTVQTFFHRALGLG